VFARSEVSTLSRVGNSASGAVLCVPLIKSRTVATPRASSSSPSNIAAMAPILSARRSPAHQLDEPIISASPHHRALGAEVGGHELERRMRVVVETSHELRVQPIAYAEPLESGTDLVEELARRGIEVIGKGRGIPHDRPVGFLLRIEYAQRVTFEPTPAVLRQFSDPCREIGDERFSVGGTACRIAQRVEL